MTAPLTSTIFRQIAALNSSGPYGAPAFGVGPDSQLGRNLLNAINQTGRGRVLGDQTKVETIAGERIGWLRRGGEHKRKAYSLTLPEPAPEWRSMREWSAPSAMFLQPSPQLNYTTEAPSPDEVSTRQAIFGDKATPLAGTWSTIKFPISAFAQGIAFDAGTAAQLFEAPLDYNFGSIDIRPKDNGIIGTRAGYIAHRKMNSDGTFSSLPMRKQRDTFFAPPEGSVFFVMSQDPPPVTFADARQGVLDFEATPSVTRDTLGRFQDLVQAGRIDNNNLWSGFRQPDTYMAGRLERYWDAGRFYDVLWEQPGIFSIHEFEVAKTWLPDGGASEQPDPEFIFKRMIKTDEDVTLSDMYLTMYWLPEGFAQEIPPLSESAANAVYSTTTDANGNVTSTTFEGVAVGNANDQPVQTVRYSGVADGLGGTWGSLGLMKRLGVNVTALNEPGSSVSLPVPDVMAATQMQVTMEVSASKLTPARAALWMGLRSAQVMEYVLPLP